MIVKFNDIKKIYDDYITPKYCDEYLNKYKVLPIDKMSNKWRWEGKDLPRVISLMEFQEFMLNNKFHFQHVLSFNGVDDPEYQYINYDNIHNYYYLDDTENYDLHTLNLEKKDFDLFMCNQTIEHVYDPCLVLRNIYDHLKPGGILYINVPSFTMAHDTPHHHYIGLTPTGLGSVVKQGGFEIMDIGFWGNTEYINFMMNENEWPDYQKISNYCGEKDKEVISWIFAKKPL
jgi:SAM-dependent methyltransferase